VTLTITTTEYRAGLLLETLVEKAKRTPSGLPERAEWLSLARQVVDSLAEQRRVEANGRGV
jgi:hypothetical protein